MTEEREHWLTRAMNLGFTVGRFAEVVQREVTARTRLSPIERVRLWRYGFTSPSAELYGMAQSLNGDYLSDYARFVETPRINDRFSRILDNKLAFQYVLETLRPGSLPRILATIHRGTLTLTGSTEQLSVQQGMQRLLGGEHTVVLKPVEGTLGTGIHFLSATGDGVPVIDGKRSSWSEVIDLVARCRAHVLVEFLHQGAYARSIVSETTNTIRLITMRMPDTGEAFVPAAVHRFGSPRSGVVDTWHQGGVVAAIDLDSGVLGSAVPYRPDGRSEHLSHHPDTGERIEGVQIPRWSEIMDEIRDVARRLPFLPYIGWDLLVTDDGFRILEGNNRTGLDLVQVHAPLLRDPRARTFYEYYGVSLPRSAPGS